MLKPFITQLQTTFIKSLSEPNRNVRFHAAKALGSLMTILSARIDSLVNELLTGVNSAEGGVQEAMLSALRQVLLKAGGSVPPEVMAKVGSSLVDLLGSEEENIRAFSAKTIGAYSKFLTPENLDNLLTNSILNYGASSWQLRHGSSVALTSLLHHNPTLFSKYQKPIIQMILKYLKDEKVPVRQSIAESVGEILLQPDIATGKTIVEVDGDKIDVVADLLNKTSDLLNDESSDVKIPVLRVIKKFAKAYPMVTKDHLNTLVQKVFGKVKERTNLPVKLAAERTLMHVLQVHTNPKLVDEYCATLDATTGRALSDYCKRILAKLSQDSESEEDEK